MYYVFNYISCYFTLISIAAVYEKNTPSWLILILLLVAGCFQMIATARVVTKHDELEKRIKNLENKKEEKNDES